MALWILIYFLFMLALVGVAIYEHHTAATLSLPLSPALRALAIALPLLGLANSLLLPDAFPSSSPVSPRRNRGAATVISVYTRVFQAAQLLQLILAVVLSTSFFGDAVPSAVRICLLSTTWQRLFVSKDADAIRRIQDAFNCCGLNSVRDRAWPFAEDISRGGGVACAERFGRAVSCAGPWTTALQRSAGIEGGSATAVAVLQVVLFLLWQWISSRQAQRGAGGWPRQLLAPFTSERSSGGSEAGTRRPLLGSSPANGRIEEEEEPDEEEDSPNADTENGTTRNGGNGGNGGYGGTAGPRVEPSYNQPGQSEPNAWTEDA